MTMLEKRLSSDTAIRLLLYSIIVGNIIILSIVFLYPRLMFVINNWGASEREILLSKGPKDNPNMEHLRKFYKMMYFVKDHTEEDSEIYFINPHFSKAEAYKILLPRSVYFFELHDKKDFSPPIPQEGERSSYCIFTREDKPERWGEDEVIWDRSGWGLCKIDMPSS